MALLHSENYIPKFAFFFFLLFLAVLLYLFYIVLGVAEWMRKSLYLSLKLLVYSIMLNIVC